MVKAEVPARMKLINASHKYNIPIRITPKPTKSTPIS
jgi:hypothetical protein